MDKISPEVRDKAELAQPSPLEAPPTSEVLSYLDVILKSGVFSGAARQQRLLRHLVEKRIQGSAGDLKEYTLGVEVFDRGDDFDPRLDPIVRVEASRLRSRLQRYYDTEGATDRMRITLPRGAYVPCFENPAAAPVAVIPAEPETVAPPSPPILPDPPPATDVQTRKPQRTIERFWPFALVAVLAFAAGISLLLFRRPVKETSAPYFVNFRRITDEQTPCTSPSFSPDGKSLVYARREAGKWDLYQRELNSLAFTDLTPESSADNNTQPAWSPDGKTIAFRSDRDGGGIFLLDTSTRSVSRLTTVGYHPSWSPDSSEIVFSTETFADPAENSGSRPGSLEVVTVKSKQVRKLGAPGAIYDAVQPAWSPDGKRIAFWGMDPDGDRDIWTVSADASEVRPLKPVRVTHDAWNDWSATWSPDGRYLYFSSDRGGSMNLWRVRIDQDTGDVYGRPESVTTPSPYSGWISFAANGKEFAYVHRLVSSQLFRAPFDPAKGVQLGQKVQLTSGERSIREPDIAPDGKWVVVRLQDPQEDLALIRPDGTDLHRLTNDVFSDRNPRWSPDGKQIVFISNRSRRHELWSIRPDATGLRQLSKDGATSYAWTPDGTLVAFPVLGKAHVIEPEGRALPDLSLPSAFRPMSWSPNRQSVAGRMHSDSFSGQALFIFTASSADYWQIARSASYPSLAWLKGGDQLLFSQSEGIFVADSRTHQVRAVTPASHVEMHSRFTLSADNRTFFFAVSDDEEDVWIARQ